MATTPSNAAHNSAGTHLYYTKDFTTWTETPHIKKTPKLRGEPNTIETTTLADLMQTYIQGIIKMDGNLAFPINYNSEDVDALIALEGTSYTWVLVFGGTIATNALSTGNVGAFSWKGTCVTSVEDADVDKVLESTLYISPSTKVEKIAALPTA